MKCPICGSRHVAPIYYGMQNCDAETRRKLENKELFHGGCCIPENMPKYYCFACNQAICTLPILRMDGKMVDYRDVVKGISFRFGSCLFAPEDICFQVEYENSHLMVKAHRWLATLDGYLYREMTEDEWRKMLNRLFCKLYVHEWKREFEQTGDIVYDDGYEFRLTIEYSDGTTNDYYGCNAYPPYWVELKTTFRPYFAEAGIRI